MTSTLGVRAGPRALPSSVISIIAILLGVGCHSPTRARQLSCLTGPIAGDSLGAVHIGDQADTVRARCPGARDTIEILSEGMPQRVIKIPADPDTVDAEIVDARVSRIRVHTARFATADSIHVGTPVGRFIADSSFQAAMGEGQLFVISPQHCGLSFGLTPGAFPPRGPFDRRALFALPPSTAVEEILIIGCR